MQKTIGGNTFEIRSLTRGEIKKLRQAGFIIANLSPENADDAIDAVLEITFPDRLADIDAMPNNSVLELFKAIMEETYGTGDVAKNL